MGIFYLTHSGICYYCTVVLIIYIYTFIIMASYMFQHLVIIIIEVCLVLFKPLAILFQTYVNYINMLKYIFKFKIEATIVKE